MPAETDDIRAVASPATGGRTRREPSTAPRRSAAERVYAPLAKIVHHATWRMRLLEYALAWVEREIASTVRVPWYRRPALWRRGFLGEARVLYGLDANDPHDYISDYHRFVQARMINGSHAVLLDDKLQFARLLAGICPDRLPALHGVLSGGAVVAAGPRPADPVPLAELLRREQALVVKPSTGGGGIGFALIEDDGSGALRHNGRPIGCDELAALARSAEGHLVSAFVRQHREIAALYPHTTNTIRLVTMHDEAGEPFVARAVLRVGTDRSAPTDNWRKGGLSAAIDPADGTLGRAAAYPGGDDRLRWHARHPDTDAPIEGVRVPHWGAIGEGILEIARALPFLPYVGWDLVATGDGFAVIEGNNYTGTNLLQIHGPLLADPRIAGFYARHGIGHTRRT